MTQQMFPDVQAAAEALEKRITLTEAEIAQMKESIKTNRAFIRTWKKALTALSPVQPKKKSPKNLAGRP